MKYLIDKFKKLGVLVVGVFLVAITAYNVEFAHAETKAILDLINRAFFIATGSQNMRIGTGASSTGNFKLLAAGTPIAEISTNGISYEAGKGDVYPPNTAVFAATAVAGTNVLVPGYNIPGATPTANHLVLVGSATAIPGAVYDFYNGSAASLKLKAPSGVTMNGATAGGTLVVAALTSARCVVSSATNIDCRLQTNPTPAAP